MKAINSLLAAALLAPASFGQAGVIAQGNVTRANFSFYWSSRLEPPSPPLANNLGYASGFSAPDNSVYRVMIDRTARIYFGYSVRVEVLPGNMYRLAFLPLNLTPEIFKRIHIDDPASWKKLEINPPEGRPLYPFRQSPGTVAELDVVAVDLMMNPSTNQKIVDYVVLQRPARSWSFGQLDTIREFTYPTGAAHDFKVEDANLRFSDARLSINGKVEELSGPREVSGALVWIYVPNRGRYVLSLAPHDGLQKAGEVRGTSASFSVGPDRFVMASDKSIVSADDAFNLYVRFEGGWRPSYPNANVSSPMIGK